MRIRFTALLALVALFAACSSSSGITDPSKNKTDTLTGTILAGAAGNLGLNFFVVNSTGELSATLTSLTPQLALFVPMEFIIGPASPPQNGQQTCGVFSGSVLADVPFQTNGKTSTLLVSNQLTTAGNYCMALIDTQGRFTNDENYVVSIDHP
jgi:hypothetical protein